MSVDIRERLEAAKKALHHAKQTLNKKVKAKSDMVANAAMVTIATVASYQPHAVHAERNVYDANIEVNAPEASFGDAPEIVADELLFDKDMVNVSSLEKYPHYEFHNKVFDKRGREIKDFANATKCSVWDVTYQREVGEEANPVGVFNSYAGSLQLDMFNAKNFAIYILLHDDYKDIGDRFFNKSATGFQKALTAFKAELAQKGNLAYHSGNAKRDALARFVVPDFKQKFRNEGKNNPVEFLHAQRDFGGECYIGYNQKTFDAIRSTLAKQNIDIEDVHWVVIGLWCAKDIATGNLNGIEKTINGKSLRSINSLSYITELNTVFRGVFSTKGGKRAIAFAKEHIHDAPSLTTMRDLSLIAKDKSILDDYVQLLNKYPGKTYQEAQKLDDIQQRIMAEAQKAKEKELSAPVKKTKSDLSLASAQYMINAKKDLNR